MPTGNIHTHTYFHTAKPVDTFLSDHGVIQRTHQTTNTRLMLQDDTRKHLNYIARLNSPNVRVYGMQEETTAPREMHVNNFCHAVPHINVALTLLFVFSSHSIFHWSRDLTQINCPILEGLHAHTKTRDYLISRILGENQVVFCSKSQNTGRAWKQSERHEILMLHFLLQRAGRVRRSSLAQD